MKKMEMLIVTSRYKSGRLCFALIPIGYNSSIARKYVLLNQANPRALQNPMDHIGTIRVKIFLSILEYQIRLS